MFSRRQAISLIGAAVAAAAISVPVQASTAVEEATKLVRKFVYFDHSGFRLDSGNVWLMENLVIEEFHTGWQRFFVTGDFTIANSKQTAEGIQITVDYELLAAVDGKLEKLTTNEIAKRQQVTFHLTPDGSKITAIDHPPYVSIHTAEAIFDAEKQLDQIPLLHQLQK
ncbi:hypothetical protein [Ferrimonas senticii]|uniref:hypothetical protein n=1 Tax=Ferrimonas senticii TaxID=394566 RepID=UPI00040CFCC1|nr:hypothetical protein [Ferrimonas senticii]